MIKNFYITAKDIKDPKDKKMSLYSSELTEEILDGTTDMIQLIRKIEEFNGDKPRTKRMLYSIMVDGVNAPIFVAKAKFVTETTLVVYAYNSNGSVYITSNKDKESQLVDGISTFMLSTDKITAVNFGSFSKTDCGFLIEPDGISEDRMLSLITNELSTWNSSVGSGEYRQAINHFCIFMKDNKINDYDFNYNNAAFNKYITLCSAYMTLIRDIVARHNDKTRNVLDPNKPNKIYFFKDKAAMDEFIKIAEHTRMNITINNSFFDEDIELFNEILEKE